MILMNSSIFLYRLIVTLHKENKNMDEVQHDLKKFFTDIHLIGDGMTSQVYSAVHIETNRKVAIKQMRRDRMLNQRTREAFESELKILESCDHPFISSFYNLIESEKYFYLVMEIASRGTLLNYIKSHRQLKEKECLRIFVQIVSAINYMHQTLNIIHRDIKVDNMMFDDFFNIRLIDFGMSKIKDSQNQTLVQTTCGSFPFIAPEILKNEKYDKEVDVWSLGICLYIMATGQVPFNSTNQKILIEQILHDDPIYPQNLSEGLVDILKAMLNRDPAKRIKLNEIKFHPWVLNSQFSSFFSDDFVNNPNFYVNETIDEKILERMVKCGFDPGKFRKLGTPDAMFYRIMRRSHNISYLRFYLMAIGNHNKRKGIKLCSNAKLLPTRRMSIGFSQSLDLKHKAIMSLKQQHKEPSILSATPLDHLPSITSTTNIQRKINKKSSWYVPSLSASKPIIKPNVVSTADIIH